MATIIEALETVAAFICALGSSAERYNVCAVNAQLAGITKAEKPK